MRDGDPGWLTTVAAEYAAHGAIDDALVRAATAAQVGLVTIDDEGRVWWSDEAYRLHGRPRWRRVRTIDDLAWGLRDAGSLRRAYIGSLEDPEVELRYTAIGESGETRELVLRGLDRGLCFVHRATARPEPAVTPTGGPVPEERPAGPAPVVVDVRERLAADEPETPEAAPAREPAPSDAAPARDDSTQADDRTDGPAEDARLGLATAVLSATPDLLLLVELGSGTVVSMAGNAAEGSELVEHLRQGGSLRDDVHPDDLPQLVAWGAGFADLAEGEVRHIDTRLRVGGEWRWRELRVSEFRRDGDGRVVEVVLIVRDVHDRVESTLRVAESERAFREVFGASPVGLAVIDGSGRFTDVNDSFCTLVGRTREAVLATVYEALLHPQDRAAAVISRARRITETSSPASSENRIVRADGSTMWVRVRTSEIDYHGRAHVLVSLEDVSAAKATEDQLRHDALHDELTGLPNRRLLIDRLERALVRSRRSGTSMAVFFIDLDDLKRVNDTHPWKHRAGDELLTSVANAVRETLRDADTLGRLGGDEFVAICEDVGDDATVEEIGARILEAATRLLTIGGETIRPGASIGVAVAGEAEESADTIMRRADAAMYRAKSSGGSRMVRADIEGRTVTTSVDLAAAISRNELTQHYQPVVSLATGAVLGVTTVVRWRGSEGRRLPAYDIHSSDDASVRAPAVVHWSVAQAIADVRTVAPTRVDHLSVWVPLSARAALSSSMRSAVSAAVAGPDGRQTSDSAPSIVLDLHENEVASVTRRHGAQHHLDELLESGPLAIGVGHFTADAVPLGVLQQLSAASVSLDATLLEEAAQSGSTAEVVQALVAAATALGVVTIAMDVDSHEQLEVARALGVHAVHGDLVGPPAPLDTYSDLLHGGRITLPAPTTSLAVDGTDVDELGAPPEVEPDETPIDEWARQMTARLAQDATETLPTETQRTETPRPEAAPTEAAATEVAPVVPPAPVVEPVEVAWTRIAPVEPTVEPETVVERIDVATLEAIPTIPSLPPPVVPTPSVPGDIGGDLARELGMSWLFESAAPGSAAPVNVDDTPQWDALAAQLRPQDPQAPQS